MWSRVMVSLSAAFRRALSSLSSEVMAASFFSLAAWLFSASAFSAARLASSFAAA